MKERGNTISYFNTEAQKEHEQKEYDYMFTILQKTKDGIVTARDLDPQSGLYTYNPLFNILLYTSLKQFENPRSTAYLRIRDEVQKSTIFDLRTMLGERYHVGISRYMYFIKDGKITTNDNVPLLDLMKRGRDYRRIYGNEIDWEREDAEVIGFEQIEKDFVDSKTPVGTIRCSISLPGKKDVERKKESIYTMNFYDTFTKTDEGIEARRYTSALTAEEYIQRLSTLNPRINTTYIPTPEEFLRSPLRFDLLMPGKTADDVHRFFHKEHEYMEEEDLVEILDVCDPLIHRFVELLTNNPNNHEEILLMYNTILNTADRIEKNITRRKKGQLYEVITRYDTEAFTHKDIWYYGQQQAEQRMSGCGISSSFSLDMFKGVMGTIPAFSLLGIRSVGDIAHLTDDKGPLAFTCPNIACGKINIRPYGQLLERCVHCLADVSCRDEKSSEKKEEKNNEPISLFERKKEMNKKVA